MEGRKWGEPQPIPYREAMGVFLRDGAQVWSASGFRRYKTSAKPLTLHFGGKTLAEIDGETLSEYERKRRTEGASAPTIRRDLACLSSMWAHIMTSRNLPAEGNPVKAYLKQRQSRGLREAPPRQRYLSHDEEDRLLAACTRDLAPLVAFAIDTGLRLEEQLSLTWPQVNLVRGEVRVIGKGSKRRTVPLNDRARTILGTVPRHIRRNGEPDYVFCNRLGNRYGKRTRGLAAACARAGIEGLRWHDLRRTCGCRRLQDDGLSLAEVRDWLGHQSVVQTERAYAFLAADGLRAAIERSARNPAQRARILEKSGSGGGT